jgi:hypothetical protein
MASIDSKTLVTTNFDSSRFVTAQHTGAAISLDTSSSRRSRPKSELVSTCKILHVF